MTQEADAAMEKQAIAHNAVEVEDLARLRALSMRQRGQLIEAACEAAADIYNSRLAAGMPKVERAPWPASTWEFLRKQAASVRK